MTRIENREHVEKPRGSARVENKRSIKNENGSGGIIRSEVSRVEKGEKARDGKRDVDVVFNGEKVGVVPSQNVEEKRN
ncbi:hypothetical protein L1887_31558 [Cichorium endivia]|nr:hypothetical protein L1887_31558 [Cichorium endivia]